MWDCFVATAGQPGGLGFLTEQLSELVVIDGDTMADPAEGSHAVDRITLRHLLLSDLEDTVHFGKTFTRYEQYDGKVTAFFDDGSCASADLLVGADGAGSVARRQFLPHAQRVPTEAIGTALAEYQRDAAGRRPPQHAPGGCTIRARSSLVGVSSAAWLGSSAGNDEDRPSRRRDKRADVASVASQDAVAGR